MDTALFEKIGTKEFYTTILQLATQGRGTFEFASGSGSYRVNVTQLTDTGAEIAKLTQDVRDLRVQLMKVSQESEKRGQDINDFKQELAIAKRERCEALDHVRDQVKRHNEELAKLGEVIRIVDGCTKPEPRSFYDEEGIEGWEWEHRDGRTWTEVGDHSELPPLHPEAAKFIEEQDDGEEHL